MGAVHPREFVGQLGGKTLLLVNIGDVRPRLNTSQGMNSMNLSEHCSVLVPRFGLVHDEGLCSRWVVGQNP